jgi:hypothetical protein
VNVLQDFAFAILSDGDVSRVIQTMMLYVRGAVIYEDAGKRQWETGFSYVIEVDPDSYEGSKITPLPGQHWLDRSLNEGKLA